MTTNIASSPVPGSSRRISLRLSAALLLGCAMSTLSVQPASAQASNAAREFAIAPQPLVDAMREFSRTTGIQVVYSAPAGSGGSSPGVSGTLSPAEALSRLLGGTGLTYRFTGANAVTLEPAPQAAAGTVQLGTLRVEGASGQGGATGSGGEADAQAQADRPFRTPGSTAHVSREQIDRVAPTSPGDLFVGVPGVVNSGTHVGASLNINIRGMQGMGRVTTTVDGSHQTSTSFRGYPGSRDETYVDPDMIGGIDVSKGPADGLGGGGIGGSVALRTISARDIVPEGEEWAVRVRGSLGNNTDWDLVNQAKDPDWVVPSAPVAADRSDFLTASTWSGSIALGLAQDNFEAVAAYSRRRQGNYYSGKNAPDDMIFRTGDYMYDLLNAHTAFMPGTEVFNTSQDVESLLLKARLILDEGHSLEFGYMLYDSQHGEANENANSRSAAPLQYRLTDTEVSTYTARYRLSPPGNPLVDLRANLFYTDLSVDKGGSVTTADHGMKTYGGDVENTALVDTDWGLLTISAGAEYRREQGWAEQTPNFYRWTSWGPSGVRAVGGAFARARLDPMPWLQLTAGGRVDFYSARGEGYAAVNPGKSASRFSPNLTALVEPVEGIQLYASYKEGMRAPNLRELYWNYLDNVFINPDLRPEISKSREVGINILQDGLLWGDDKLRLKLAYYDNHYTDYIQTMPIEGFRYHFDNIPKALHEGIDISASYHTGWFFADLALNHFLAIELCTADGVCQLAKGDVIPIMGPPDFANYRPAETSGSGTLGVRLFDQALTLGGRARFSSTRYGSSWPPAALQSLGYGGTWPSYAVFDLFGSLELGRDTQLNVSVENIADRYYLAEASTAGVPSPGRTGRVTFTQRLAGGGGFLPRLPAISLGRAGQGAPGENWTGLYAGLHAGYVSASTSGEVTAPDGSAVAATEAAEYSADKITTGVHLGFSYQLPGRIVLGVEGDFTTLGLKGDWRGTPMRESATMAQAGNWESATQYGLDSYSTLRARLGYAPGRTLFYVTGGAAFLNEYGTRDQHIADTGSQALPYGNATASWFTETAEATRTGWTAGAGIEHAVTRHLTLRLEYLHAGFGRGDALNFDQARAGVGRSYGYTVETEYCMEDGFCFPDIQYLRHTGSSETVVGRQARNRSHLNNLRVGVSFRF